MRRILLIVFALIGFEAAIAQTNPLPITIQSGAAYTLNSWDSTQAAMTYPPGMMFHMASILDPGLDTPMTRDYIAAYNLTTQTRVMGRGADGFAFINTSTARDGGYLGAAVLSFNASSLTTQQQLFLSFQARTWVRNFRPYAFRVQYRTDATSTWSDVTNLASQPMEYVADSLNTWASFGFPLPSTLIGKPFAQIRWKYYFIPGTGATGARPLMGLDDIKLEAITSTSIHEQTSPEVNVWPNPGTGDLHFNQEVRQIEVFSLQGQWLGTHQLPASSRQFSLNGLKNGLYLLRLQTLEGSSLLRYSKTN